LATKTVPGDPIHTFTDLFLVVDDLEGSD